MRGTAQPLVGRRTELRFLENRLLQPVDDGPPIVAVTGEAGIGKSRLVTEVRRKAADLGISMLSGSCLHLAGGSAPLASISAAINDVLRSSTAADRRRLLARLTDLAPLLPGSFPDEPADAQQSPQFRQQRIFESLLELFTRMGHDRLLLVLEDLHWADDATTDFLRFAARNARNQLISVVTLRTDPGAADSAHRQLLRELERAGDLHRLELGPLDADDIGRIVANLTGRLLTDSESIQLHGRTDGNPYFAQELALAGLSDPAGVPPSLQDVLLARFATQPPRVQLLLRALSVLGREATTELLLAVHDIGLQRAEVELRQALRARLIERVDGADGYRFRHNLMRDAVYADLLPSERRRLHLLAASAIQDSGESRADAPPMAAVLAHHWEAGGDADRALVARSEAAAAAQAAGALNDAYRQARAALNLWTRASATARAATGRPGTLHMRFAVLAHGNGHYEEALHALAEAESLGVPRNTAERVLLLDYRCNIHWSMGQYSAALAAAEEACQIAPASRPELKSRAHRMMAGIHYLQRRPAEALAYAREGLPYAIAAGDRIAERYLRWVIASCSLDEGDVGTALAEASLSYSLDADIEPLEAFSGPANFAALLASCGRYQQLEQFAVIAQDSIRNHGLDQTHGNLLGNSQLLALMRLGRLAEAEEMLERLNSSHDLVHELAAERTAFAAELRIRQGRFREAAELIERCNDERTAWTQEWTTAVVATAEGELAAGEGQPEGAIGRLMTEWAGLAARVSTLRLRLLATLMRLHADARRMQRGRSQEPTGADELHGIAVNLLAELEGRVTEWDALLVQADAEYLRMTGEKCVDRWTEAVRLWDQAGLPYEASYARCRLGDVLLAARRRRSAGVVLRDAQASASGIGAEAVARLAGEIMARGRVDTGERVAIPVATPNAVRDSSEQQTALDGLSPREREVLELVAAGMTNRQISEQLFISEKTAATHVSNILGKLLASSRAQAAAMLVGARSRPG